MTGWQRFFLLLVFCCCILVWWPQYDGAGLAFLGMAALLWTCIIVLFSVLINLFAIYKLEWIHRLLSIGLIGLMAASLLYYFPLKNGETPASRLKDNKWPTLQDAREGMKRLTFNFDFVRRNVHRDANFVNQKLNDTSDKTKEIKKSVKKTKETLDIIVGKMED